MFAGHVTKIFKAASELGKVLKAWNIQIGLSLPVDNLLPHFVVVLLCRSAQQYINDVNFCFCDVRTSFAKTKIKNKRKLGVSDGDGVRRKAAKKTPEDDESAAAAKDWMTDDEAGDEDSDDGKEEDQVKIVTSALLFG